MTDEPAPDFDPFTAPLQQPLSRDLMEAFNSLPALWAADAEGREDPVTIPPEQVATAMRKVVMVLMQHVPNMAGQLDVLKSRVAQLERRLEAVEQEQ